MSAELTSRFPRMGVGFDVHQLTEGRPLILGGVTVPFSLGLDGHSDADVLCHAISDALLGAAALGDIGVHFPPTEQAYKGADSIRLLTHVVRLLAERNYCIGNVDSVIACEKPKLAAFILQMRERLAGAMSIPLGCVSVKATTTEKLGFTGRQEGIAAYATAVIFPKDSP